MISRRNIRVKVMQTVYALETLSVGEERPEPESLLKNQLDNSRKLLVFLIHSLGAVAHYAQIYARQRASKHLPSEEDLQINTKIAGNTLLARLLDSPSYQNASREDKPQLLEDPELTRKLYLDLVKTEEYQSYIANPERDSGSERAMLDFIFNQVLLPDDRFTGLLEECFSNWNDDAEMMQALVSSFIQKPQNIHFQDLISEEKWKFAKDLLQATLDKKEVALSLIKPKLKNWDPDRIAMLDMILMRMGVCEFLFFETIPPKVTINEYIDLAKEYSTPQSGHFVNGILDNIHKDLLSENKMHKINFKPSR